MQTTFLIDSFIKADVRRHNQILVFKAAVLHEILCWIKFYCGTQLDDNIPQYTLIIKIGFGCITETSFRQLEKMQCSRLLVTDFFKRKREV